MDYALSSGSTLASAPSFMVPRVRLRADGIHPQRFRGVHNVDCTFETIPPLPLP